MTEDITLEEYRRSRRSSPERNMQQALIVWRDDLVKLGIAPELRWLHAVPNGGERPGVEAALMVAEGETAGVSDLCLPVARHGYHGAYFELKSPHGTLKPAQREFIEFVRAGGYFAEVYRTVRAVQDALVWYLSISEDPRVLALF